MTRKRTIGAVALVAAIAGLFVGQRALDAHARVGAVTAPTFEVDPMWPKPLPNHWVLGNVIGVGVDARDHVFIVHRVDTADSLTTCCVPAPPVIEFDPQGNVVSAWGGPHEGYVWPGSNHGISIDNKGNVWIGGNGEKDAHLLKFTNDGKFIMQVGHLGGNKGSNDLENFGRVAKIWVDPSTNEAYIADGYLNKRVAVIDADTGKMKRYWGAYGNKPDDTNLGPYNPSAPPAQQFRNPVHCIERSVDNLVYVCDRQSDRLQVFKPDGTFVKEAFYAKNTRGAGAVWDIVFSKDPKQRYIMMADGQNERVRVIVRDTLEEITSFGDGGRQPGQFYGVHSIASDSKGNLYTTETYEGKRIQRFLNKGMAPVTAMNQGVLWPTASK